MNKTLNTIQTIVKVARIIAKIVFVLCIIGAVGSVLGLGAIIAAGGIIEEYVELIPYSANSGELYFACIIACISCVAEAVLAHLAIKYFDRELLEGTPFTFGGSKELFKLGIINIAVAVGIGILQGIVYVILWVYFPELEGTTDYNASIGTGLAMMLLSLVFKYGAETASPAFDQYEDEEKERIIF